MRTLVSAIACVLGLVIIGCSQDAPTTRPSTSTSTFADDGSNYLLTSEPDDATGVIKVRDVAMDEDDVIIVGRIGGSRNPWVENRAGFSIVDRSLKSCLDVGCDDCEKPWDFC